MFCGIYTQVIRLGSKLPLSHLAGLPSSYFLRQGCSLGSGAPAKLAQLREPGDQGRGLICGCWALRRGRQALQVVIEAVLPSRFMGLS